MIAKEGWRYLLSIMCQDLKQELYAVLGTDKTRLRFDEPMSRHTSFRIGGKADVYFEPAGDLEIIQALQFCRTNNIPCTVIGNGSNILVADSGIRGLVLVIGDHYAGITCVENQFEAKAGTRLTTLAAAAARNRYTGLEFAAGIPGTVGGAIQMNAGAYGSCMQDVVVETTFLDDQLQYCKIKDEEHRFEYRRSIFSEHDFVILHARLSLNQGDPDQIMTRMAELSESRRRTQPLEFPSAGSVFKRPPGYYAGKLISDCQLKGLSVGDAKVSEKHAGFIINTGRATAQDVRRLITQVQTIVAEKTGIWLETEIKFIGDW